jgi:hypothetical protein
LATSAGFDTVVFEERHQVLIPTEKMHVLTAAQAANPAINIESRLGVDIESSRYRMVERSNEALDF